MMIIDSNKVRLDAIEVDLIVEGLAAGARENFRMAQDAIRLGFRPQAAAFERQGQRFAEMAGAARSKNIERITIRHS